MEAVVFFMFYFPHTKKEELIIEIIMFLIAWIVVMFIWSIWLDGIMIPLIALITALMFDVTVHLVNIETYYK